MLLKILLYIFVKKKNKSTIITKAYEKIKNDSRIIKYDIIKTNKIKNLI